MEKYRGQNGGYYGYQRICRINQRKEYGYPQFTGEEIETARENGFVIVYGASDDLMEFNGAVQDEVGCYEGGTAWISGNRVMETPAPAGDMAIRAVWCGNERDERGERITWTYETEIPHETFMIYEDGEPYCRGIVFHLKDARANGKSEEMGDLISRKALMSHIESEYRQWGEDYDAEQILGDIEDFETALSRPERKS